MIELVTFGIIIDDIIFPDGSSCMGVLGGGGAQTAWGMAAALGHGATVGLVSGVGTDLDSNWLAPLKNAGINLEGLRANNFATPRAWQLTETDGRRTQVWRTPPEQLGEQLARKAEYLPETYHDAKGYHWGIHPENFQPHFAQTLHQAGARVSLEPFKASPLPLKPEQFQQLIGVCSIFSPTEAELVSLVGVSDEFYSAQMCRDWGGQYLVVRRGAKGARVWDLNAGIGYSAPALKTSVVDEVGAGNAFCGAFLATLEQGCAEALAHAITVASYVVEQVGLPTHLPNDYQTRWDKTYPLIEKISL